MELTFLQLGFIVFGILFFITLQSILAFYFETRMRRGRRISLNFLPEKQRSIVLLTTQGDYSFPLVDISKKGMSFMMDQISEELLIARVVHFRINFLEGMFDEILRAQLIYIKTSEEGPQIRVGVEFEKPLDEMVFKYFHELSEKNFVSSKENTQQAA